jgi:hypothetical protein
MNATQHLMQDPTFRDLIQSFERMNNDREAEAAKRDPLKNKLTRVFEPGVSTSYRYYGPVKNRKGQKVRFCYSTRRNAAGFFLGWRETWMKNGTVKRDQWISRRVKARCAEIAERRRNDMSNRITREGVRALAAMTDPSPCGDGGG